MQSTHRGAYAHTPIRPYAHTPTRPYAHTPTRPPAHPLLNSQVQYHNVTEAYLVGGVNGTYTLIDLDGTEYHPGTSEYDGLLNGTASLWAGQHNVEYFGDDLVFL